MAGTIVHDLHNDTVNDKARIPTHHIITTNTATYHVHTYSFVCHVHEVFAIIAYLIDKMMIEYFAMSVLCRNLISKQLFLMTYHEVLVNVEAFTEFFYDTSRDCRLFNLNDIRSDKLIVSVCLLRCKSISKVNEISDCTSYLHLSRYVFAVSFIKHVTSHQAVEAFDTIM